MKLDGKIYKLIKTKKYFKIHKIFFFVQGVNQNSSDRLSTKQKLCTIKFTSYQLLNQIAIKTLNASIYYKNKFVIKSNTFLVKPHLNYKFLKHLTLNTFNSLFFELLLIKFNNRVYSPNSLKNIYSFNYFEKNLLFYQFCKAHLKNWYKLSK
jgi:hypothetical protein